MAISFCAIRLEIEEGSPTLDHLQFSAGRSIEDLFKDMELTNPLAAQAIQAERAKRQTGKDSPERGNRRPNDISVETLTQFDGACANSKESSPPSYASVSRASSCKRSTKDSTPASVSVAGADSASSGGGETQTVSFSSGNPFVEVTRGILHLYKENHTTSLEEGVIRSQMLCMLGVPAKHKTPDLLQFTAPCHSRLEMMRIINDGSPNQFMVLLRFQDQSSADEFYRAFNGLPFNSLEPEVCSLAYVSKVETCKESEFDPLSGDHTELPVCSICLERMDESISTLLTILCNHSFHGNCLAQWEDTTCPVCRYVQSPEVVAEQRCSECSSSDDLWICLICGYVGCGRYVGGHSHAHFIETAHSYTMELGASRVWDYVGDNFVHRLLQTDSNNGKLVEGADNSFQGNLGCTVCGHGVANGASDGARSYHDGLREGGGGTDSPACYGGGGKRNAGNLGPEEKIDSIQLEYTYLLTSQLESQRRYFEEKLARVEENASRELDEVLTRAKSSAEECDKVKVKLDSVSKEKGRTDRRVTELNLKLSKAATDLSEERQMNESLRRNQSDWQERTKRAEVKAAVLEKQKDAEIQDLKEQLRDLMFYMEAQNKIAESPMRSEIEGGEVVLTEDPRLKQEHKTGAKPKKKSSNR